MARTSLNALYVPSKVNNFNPPVRSVCLRNPGTTRGIWLIKYDSLMDHLDRLMEEQEKARRPAYPAIGHKDGEDTESPGSPNRQLYYDRLP